MKALPALVFGVLLFSFSAGLRAATFYVNAANANPAPPYADWSSAATNIQDAIDAAAGGDLIVVTNGVYASGGGRSMDGTSTNRVTLDKAVTVQSVNGPLSTVIRGLPFTGNSHTNMRCAWLTNGAALMGFTLEGGGSANDGNLASVSGGGAWCASSNAIIANCIVISNQCMLGGGGIYQGTVFNSLITSNNAASGSGVYCCNLKNCTIVSNSLPGPGVDQQGGSGNFTATNCIIDSYQGGTYSYCCATPLPAGVGNFTNAPLLFVDKAHLTGDSPCIGAGTNVTTGTDLFGQTWNNPPAVGCAEWTGAPVVTAPRFSFEGAPAGFEVGGAAIDGASPMSFSWLKDGETVQAGGLFSGSQTTNLTGAALNVSAGGDYQLVVSNAYGAATSAVASLVIHCVNGASTNPAAPYNNWDTAATNIQAAIEAASVGDVVLVTNGIYAAATETGGGIMTNTVTIDRPVTVTSVNGPFETFIQGGQTAENASAARCAWLTNNAALIGFTLRWGYATVMNGKTGAGTGGGALCSSSSSLVANCVIVSNAASEYGGGVMQGTVRNCFIYSNTVNSFSGGSGAAFSTLCNSTLVSNASQALNSARATNCIIEPVAYAPLASYSYCCGVYGAQGPGNFTNAPLFQPDGIHLQSDSPCISAGTNVAIGADLFGQLWNNPPSIGCAEFSPYPVVATPSVQLLLSPAGFAVGNAGASGAGPLTLWWLKNGVPLTDNARLTGSQTATLTASGVEFSDAGDYQLVVSNSYGVVTSSVVSLVVHCVDAAAINSTAPYASWATAATNIQDAIDAAAPGEVIIVTNGVYTGGGKSADGVITNRVTLDKSIIVQSANGPFVTAIDGAYDPASTNGPLAVRCAWMTSNAVLSGFTLEEGATRNGSGNASTDGGGLYAVSSNAVVFNCVFTNDFALYGGGAAYGTINNSLFAGNCAFQRGGGAYGATLNNCTVTRNYSTEPSGIEEWGDGIYGCIVKNSIVWGNGGPFPVTATVDDWAANVPFPLSELFEYSCTTRLPGVGQASMFGAGTVSNSPQFLDGIHIATTSPCRGSANAAFAVGTDLNGQPWANPPSMGCFEVATNVFVGPLTVSILATATNVGISTPSLQYGLGFTAQVTGHASSFNWTFGDGQGVTNASAEVGHEWTNAGAYTVTCTAFNLDNPAGVSASVVIHVERLLQPYFQPLLLTNGAVQITFETLVGAGYTVQYATNLVPPVSWFPLQHFAPVLGGQEQLTDTPPTNQTRFYRILAQ